MSKDPFSPSLMRRWMHVVLCALCFHDYICIQTFTVTQRRIGCRYCRKTWGMHDATKSLIPWDAELEEMYFDHYGTTARKWRE